MQSRLFLISPSVKKLNVKKSFTVEFGSCYFYPRKSGKMEWAVFLFQKQNHPNWRIEIMSPCDIYLKKSSLKHSGGQCDARTCVASSGTGSQELMREILESAEMHMDIFMFKCSRVSGTVLYNTDGQLHKTHCNSNPDVLKLRHICCIWSWWISPCIVMLNTILNHRLVKYTLKCIDLKLLCKWLQLSTRRRCTSVYVRVSLGVLTLNHNTLRLAGPQW